jgi:flavin-dependent dehydrogenase
MSPKEAMIRAKQILAESWGFNLRSEPLWTGGCTVSFLRKDLLSGVFSPAKRNVLLVGGAAGIATGSERGEGEGINMALKSGILAAEAIIETKDSSQEASQIYLIKLKPVIEACNIINQNPIFYQSNWAEREKVLERIA